jgi:UDP-N-acetylmuramoyl-L-alanyl-D-glutamate--2,6-diaminopimelate ligase
MTFQQLLQGAEVLSQSGNPAVAGVEYDSRRVRPGSVFVAMKGETSDGNRFIDQAIAAGAVAVVTDSAAETPRSGGCLGASCARTAGACSLEREFL